MRTKILFYSMALTSAVVAGGFTSSSLLADYSRSLNDAKSLSANYIVQQVGGAMSRYSVDLKKPNLARIDEPDRLIVADGNQITTFEKSQKIYYHQAETPETLNALFQTDALNPWAGFFQNDAFKPSASRDLGSEQKGGQSYAAVEAQYGPAVGGKKVTYYLDPSDKIARLEEIVQSNGSTQSTTILKTKTLDVNGGQRPDLYTFIAPGGAAEVNYADVVGAKWLTDLAEAKKEAAFSGRKIFVDFFATWCGPCKMLQHEVLETSQFKKIASSKLVLLRIDVDAQPEVSQQYSIEAMPTQMVLDAKGSVLNKIVGYGGPDMFYQFLNQSLG